jgi:hypothetical protein
MDDKYIKTGRHYEIKSDARTYEKLLARATRGLTVNLKHSVISGTDEFRNDQFGPWKHVPIFQYIYYASPHGLIKNRFNHILSFRDRAINVKLMQITYTVAEIILLTFKGDMPLGTHISHKDGRKRNNHIDNLQYLCDTCLAPVEPSDTHSCHTADVQWYPTHLSPKYEVSTTGLVRNAETLKTIAHQSPYVKLRIDNKQIRISKEKLLKLALPQNNK